MCRSFYGKLNSWRDKKALLLYIYIMFSTISLFKYICCTFCLLFSSNASFFICIVVKTKVEKNWSGRPLSMPYHTQADLFCFQILDAVCEKVSHCLVHLIAGVGSNIMSHRHSAILDVILYLKAVGDIRYDFISHFYLCTLIISISFWRRKYLLKIFQIRQQTWQTLHVDKWERANLTC